MCTPMKLYYNRVTSFHIYSFISSQRTILFFIGLCGSPYCIAGIRFWKWGNWTIIVDFKRRRSWCMALLITWDIIIYWDWVVDYSELSICKKRDSALQYKSPRINFVSANYTNDRTRTKRQNHATTTEKGNEWTTRIIQNNPKRKDAR